MLLWIQSQVGLLTCQQSQTGVELPAWVDHLCEMPFFSNLIFDFGVSGLENSAHVLEQSGKMYSATLGLVDIVRGTNSYYKLQLLEDDVQKRSVLPQKVIGLIMHSFITE